jgi:hypothetical protein
LTYKGRYRINHILRAAMESKPLRRSGPQCRRGRRAPGPRRLAASLTSTASSEPIPINVISAPGLNFLIDVGGGVHLKTGRRRQASPCLQRLQQHRQSRSGQQRVLLRLFRSAIAAKRRSPDRGLRQIAQTTMRSARFPCDISWTGACIGLCKCQDHTPPPPTMHPGIMLKLR